MGIPRRAIGMISGRLPVRALLIVVVAAVAGPLTYILLPEPSGAAPGRPVAVVSPVASPAAPPPPPPVAALVGGEIEIDDLTENPIGVVSGTPTPAVDGLIGWPVSDHTPSTGFGYRSDPFTHRQRWHDGVDLGQPCNDPAWASLDGTVTYTGWAGGYGNRVILRHADRAGHSFETAYSHLNQIGVNVGQQVRRGDVIGQIGSTGRSTACHMHFEVILDGSYVDPMRFLTGDQSKAALSRRVGSRMPQGMPSPSADAASTTAVPSATGSAAATPSSATASTPPSGSATTATATAPASDSGTATESQNPNRESAPPSSGIPTASDGTPGDSESPSGGGGTPSDNSEEPAASSEPPTQTPTEHSESPTEATPVSSEPKPATTEPAAASDSGQGSASP